MPISTRMHGILDYLVAAVIIVVPAYFLMTGAAADGTALPESVDASQGPTAAWVLIIAGIIIVGQSLFTRYELSLVPAIPMSVHLVIDVLLGLALIASPWLFGFADIIWWPHVLVGLVALGTAALTQRASTRYDPSLDTEPRARTE